jgi:hypothetical protein
VLPALLRQPAVQRLSADAAARLLLACVEVQQHKELLLLHSHLPAAQQVAVDEASVRQLLQSAFEAQQWDTFDWLLGLPAAPPTDDDDVAIWCSVRSCQPKRHSNRVGANHVAAYTLLHCWHYCVVTGKLSALLAALLFLMWTAWQLYCIVLT